MSIKGYYLMPHPPLIIPEVGKGQEKKIQKTIDSMNQIGQEIKELSPKTIVLISPHGTMFEDRIAIVNERNIEGDLSQFGVPDVSMNLKINQQLSEKIYELSTNDDLPVVLDDEELLEHYNVNLKLDHGAIVPLYYVNKYYSDYNLIHITYAPISDLELYKFGINITKAVESLDEDVVIISSGDLSHRLKDEGPYDYSPYGKQFDTSFIDNLKSGDILSHFKMDKKIISEAGECGRRSVLIMLGALDGTRFDGELLSYEGTFGVGYGVIRISPKGEVQSKLNDIEALLSKHKENKLTQNDPYVKLARESLTTYLNTGKRMTLIPDYVTEDMKNKKRGVFVSLKKHGELRGCIGTILPTTDSVAEEIIRNSIEAGCHDPRFYEVKEDELLDIDFSVDVLTEPEPTNVSELDPKKYGVIVYNNTRRGLLLPDLEGVNTVEEQLSIALRKAGIEPDKDYKIKRFEVIRHRESNIN
ncbi:MAG: AmmeMemoRadiSam system protein A [Eubacteriales bacterium]